MVEQPPSQSLEGLDATPYDTSTASDKAKHEVEGPSHLVPPFISLTLSIEHGAYFTPHREIP